MLHDRYRPKGEAYLSLYLSSACNILKGFTREDRAAKLVIVPYIASVRETLYDYEETKWYSRSIADNETDWYVSRQITGAVDSAIFILFQHL